MGQFRKLLAHVEGGGFLVLDRSPTDAERARYPKIATIVAYVDALAVSR